MQTPQCSFERSGIGVFVKGMRENWESRQRLKNRWATPSGTFPGITNHRNRNPMSRSAARQPREWETAGHLSSRERRIQGWVRIRFRKSDGQREGKPKKKRKEHLFARQSRGLSAFPDIKLYRSAVSGGERRCMQIHQRGGSPAVSTNEIRCREAQVLRGAGRCFETAARVKRPWVETVRVWTAWNTP